MNATRTRFDRILYISGAHPRNAREGRRTRAFKEVEGLTLDECCAAHTAFGTLDELVKECLKPGNPYRPSLYTTPHGTSLLAFKRAFLATRIADAFDAAMGRAGSPKRAYRGS